MKIIFTASLMLNVFLIGLTLGGFSKSLKHESRIQKMRDHRMKEFISILPEQQRPEFRQSMESLTQANAKARKQIRMIRHEIADIFAAEPFDKELYYQKNQKIHELKSEQMYKSTRVIGEMSEHLPQEQRALLASRLIRSQKRPAKHAPERLPEHR